jgi:hypothetical protein
MDECNLEEDIYSRISIKSKTPRKVKKKLATSVVKPNLTIPKFESTISSDNNGGCSRHKLLNDKVEFIENKLKYQNTWNLNVNSTSNQIRTSLSKSVQPATNADIFLGNRDNSDTVGDLLALTDSRVTTLGVTSTRTGDLHLIDKISRDVDVDDTDVSNDFASFQNCSLPTSHPSNNFIPSLFQEMISNLSIDDQTRIKLNEKLDFAIENKLSNRNYNELANYSGLSSTTLCKFAEFLLFNFDVLNIKKFIRYHALNSKVDYLLLLTRFRLYLYSCVFNQEQYAESKYRRLLNRLHILFSSPDYFTSILESKDRVPQGVDQQLPVPVQEIKDSYNNSNDFPGSNSFHPNTKFVSKVSIPPFVYRRLGLKVPPGAPTSKKS